MNKLKPIKNKSGVALFAVLFIMMFLGILFVAFFANSQQAQRTAYRFYKSEMARQLAASGQEEAFKYLHSITDNPEAKGINDFSSNDVFRRIIDKNSDVFMDGTVDRDNASGIDLEIPITKSLAPSGMEVTATARIVDFRDTDIKGNKFYKEEGAGVSRRTEKTGKAGHETSGRDTFHHRAV